MTIKQSPNDKMKATSVGTIRRPFLAWVGAVLALFMLATGLYLRAPLFWQLWWSGDGIVELQTNSEWIAARFEPHRFNRALSREDSTRLKTDAGGLRTTLHHDKRTQLPAGRYSVFVTAVNKQRQTGREIFVETVEVSRGTQLILNVEFQLVQSSRPPATEN